jgi:CheY-like chemotaxis protein
VRRSRVADKCVGMSTPGGGAMDAARARAIVCDDDALTRSVISSLVEERGGQVIAEADRAFEAIDLIDRFGADLVVLDMSLAGGSGIDVLHHLREVRGGEAQVVIFTAFWDAARDLRGAGVRVVEKPSFDDLEQALDAALADLGTPTVDRDRRREVRTMWAAIRSASGLDDAADFYRAVASAEPGDVLIGVPVADVEVDAVARAVRKLVREQDRMTVRDATLVLLLVGGADDGAAAALRRLAETHPASAHEARVCVIDSEIDPVTALDLATGRRAV